VYILKKIRKQIEMESLKYSNNSEEARKEQRNKQQDTNKK
jgi:hypothetical protein